MTTKHMRLSAPQQEYLISYSAWLDALAEARVYAEAIVSGTNAGSEDVIGRQLVAAFVRRAATAALGDGERSRSRCLR